MILADTDILSAFAKVGRLDLLFELLRAAELHITPAVLSEIEHSYNQKHSHAESLLSLTEKGQISVLELASTEKLVKNALPDTLGEAERELIAVASKRKYIVLSNESRVAHYCREYGVSCLRVPDLLRAFWIEGFMSVEEVHSLVNELRMKDRMMFKAATLDAIFAEQAGDGI